MIRTWTDTELDLVETLTRCLRLISLAQIWKVWWPEASSQKTVRRELRRLRDGKLLLRTVVNVHPALQVKSPLIMWQPRDSQPSFERAVQRIRSRWQQLTEPTEVYWASPLAANLFGSGAGELPQLTHRDHDLLLAEVYVLYRHQRPELARRWIGEDVFPKAGYRIKNPDAFLFDEGGRPMRAIESAGRYGLQQIQSFHDHCVDQTLSYELW